MRSRQVELVCADHLDPGAADAVSREIEKDDFSVEFLFLPAKEEQPEQAEVPDPLIEEGRVHLDIIGALRDVGGEFLCDVARAHRSERQAHGKQGIRVSAEHFPVEEVAPAADHLAHDETA